MNGTSKELAQLNKELAQLNKELAQLNKELAQCNLVFVKYGYQKVKMWKPKHDYTVPAKHDCCFFNKKLRRCDPLKRTYCRYDEDCKFYKRKEKQCLTK